MAVNYCNSFTTLAPGTVSILEFFVVASKKTFQFTAKKSFVGFRPRINFSFNIGIS